MDKTYAETQNQSPFDWNLALANPPDIGSEEHDQLLNLSEDWTLCACGNQCAIIPRDAYGCPRDTVLFTAGIAFMRSIRFGDWPQARQTLLSIESRATILISQQLAALSSFTSPL